MIVVYNVMSHKHFVNILKGIGAMLVFVAAYWYFANFDKIMGTEAGKLQILQEEEAERDEELRILASEGVFFVRKIPDLPPISFEIAGGWETFSERVSKFAPTILDESKRAPRIEKGKSANFNARLLAIDNLRLDSGKKLVGDMSDTPQIRALMSNKGNKPFIDAKLDIIFMDGKDRIISRRSINPLVVSGGLFGDKVKLLQPGDSREFVADASNAPSGWIDRLETEVIYYQFLR